MKNHIRTGLYRLQNPSMDWGVAHLYEHLLIQSFRNHVTASGYSPYLYGWVSGETFEGMLFIEYGFYSTDIEELFRSFMQHTPRIDLDMLDNEIRRIEAEDMVSVEVEDRMHIRQLLQDMDNAEFTNTEEKGIIAQAEDIEESRSILKERRSKKLFRQVTVAVGLPSTSLEEKVIFTRLTPIIFDALNESLFNVGMYENEVSWPVYNKPHDAMLAHAIYTIRKGAEANSEIKAIAKRAIAKIQLHGHEKELAQYIDGFVSTPNWHTFPIDFFRHTGLIVSRADIAALFTIENVERVLNKLKVDVLATSQEHFDAVK